MACSCGASNRTFTQIVTQDTSSLPLLKYLHCKHKDQFEAIFASIGITVNEDNLKYLAQASDSGADKAGTIKNTNGQPIYFNVGELLAKIDKTKIANNMCSI